jgi:hypothetical protein
MAGTGSVTPRHELAASARRHYDEVSAAACDWLSTIPHAIDAWEREPELKAQSASEHERAERLARSNMHEAWVNCARRRLVNIRERDEARQVAMQLLRVLRVFHAAYHCETEMSTSAEWALESLSPALRRLVEE